MCSLDVNIVVPGFGGRAPSSLTVSGSLTPDTSSSVVISVKPMSSDGLVFLMTQNPDGSGDFLALFLVDGKPVFKFDVGNGPVTITSPDTIPQGVFTTIELR